MDIKKGINPLDSSKEKSIKSNHSDNTIITKEKIIKAQKRRMLILFIILLALILIIIAGVVFYFFVAKKNDNKSDKTENQEKNTIVAKYKVNTGEEIQFINENLLDKEKYKIELIEEKNRLRNLKQVSAKNKFDYTGEITININFFVKVNSLEKLFENISQLKEVNFSNFDMSEVTNLNSIFSGCSSLENVSFYGVDSRNLQTINFLFKNCINLKNVDLSPLNILNVVTMNSPFQGCQNLTINISTFPKINDDFILGTYSNVNLIANEKIYDKLNILILNNININLNITVFVEQFLDNSCEKGEKEKCKSCCNNVKGNCFLCNDGYYLPINSNNKKVCSPCSIKKHCTRCMGLTSYILCQECEEGYFLDNNICKAIDDRKEEENNESDKKIENNEKESSEDKKQDNEEEKEEEKNEKNNQREFEKEEKEEEKEEKKEKGEEKEEEEEEREKGEEEEEEIEEDKICILGDGEKCKACQEQKGIKNECSECNEGYYLPIDKTPNFKCESCGKIENCISCNGTLNLPTCNKCEIGFTLISNKCEKKSCVIGDNEKCLSCRDYSEECLSCNEGYFLPEDSIDKTKCIKCQLDGCKACSGNIMNNICTECFKNPQIKEGKIIFCKEQEQIDNCSKLDYNNKCISCNKGYKLIDGECILIENTFYAIYKAISIEEPTKIMCNYHLNFQLSDFTMYDNGEIVFPSIINLGNAPMPYIVYTFKSLGFHNVTISVHKTLSGCLGWMFGMCDNLISVKFAKNFDTRYVTSIYNMFCHDNNLTSIDMSYFNTSAIDDMVDVFWMCESISFLNLSNFETSKVTRMEGIFDYCKNLSYIDISSFNMTKVKDTKSMFRNVASNGVIKINKYFGEYKKLIPKNWTIIE